MGLKLTMVSVSARGRRITRFCRLPTNSQGRAVLPADLLDKFLDELGCCQGQTYSVG